MFVDKAKILVRGGDGGDGAAHFRREKYVPAGGPDGGDGGRGGNVEAEVDAGLATLMDFRYRTHYQAEPGEDGKGARKFGRDGRDLILKVPPGTTIRDSETGEIVADLTKQGQRAVLAFGGRGGRGNPHFTTPTRRAPKFAEQGEPAESRWCELELKLLADVGLIGYPNVGKSSIIARVSAARPKIADYPFTTLVPNLGVVDAGDGNSFVLADIPGLIEGASQGVGLGHDFLRHIERTHILLHVVDIASVEGRDPVADYHRINHELREFRAELADKPQLVLANKIDLTGTREALERFQAELGEEVKVWPVSAATGEGLDAVMHAVWAVLQPIRAQRVLEAGEAVHGIEYVGRTSRPRAETGPLSVTREGEVFVAGGEGLERLVQKLDLDNEAAVRHLQSVLLRKGVNEALRAAGVKDGDTVRIAGREFEFLEPQD